ncbi:Eco57I restriction-modification methylase domain-containing protein [Thermus antranikianii]|uniref:site-specific DNA-methyltransferase (adenine-specific) n=2 Tax=Thermus TaxID=270 RepID=A0ABY7RS52_9DEIN|nr:SAM-dependent DNA methyltransferase [Thermus antranikianii]WCM40208.1 SAM-dependent DNA methyltransferase [Thermus antranikianii]
MSPSREEVVAHYADRLHQVLQKTIAQNPNEAEFRRAVEPLLEEFLREMGLEPLARAEYTLAQGRADAIFNRLVIEYERPGVLKPKPDAATRHAVQQVKDYLSGIAQRERHAKERLAGVAFDGRYLIFVRHMGERWVEEPPVEANPHSLKRFLTWLAGLASGIALTSENLNRDFSIEQLRTQTILRGLYQALEKALAEEGLVRQLFEQWRIFFSEAIDYSETFGGRKLEPLKKWVRKAGLHIQTPEEAERFFFVLHTYFALLAKLLAWLALSRHMGVRLGAPVFSALAAADGETLQKRLGEMESGGIFRQYGILNLLEGDFFAWYLHAWSSEVERALRALIERLDEYDPTTLSLFPEETRDLFKKLYHYLLPREIRHNLGEYYTPDWLAWRLLVQLDNTFFAGTPSPNDEKLRQKLLSTRFLDPACGSGTFPVLVIGRMLELGRLLMVPERDLLEAILKNVVGFDLNPLAVLTARVNYLLAISDLLQYRQGDITIPIYLADSVRTPAEGQDLFSQGIFVFPTAVGDFQVPAALVTAPKRFDRFCEILESSIRSEVDPQAFLERTRRELDLNPSEWDDNARKLAEELYTKLLDLHRRGLNGLWARLLKNNFAPLTVGRFDYIVGNPPWINWEHLPDEYRESIKHLWLRYRIAGSYTGGRPRLGAVKVDISALMTYIVVDNLLKNGGKLGFVITQSLLKTAAGAGFRRLSIPTEKGKEVPLRIVYVDDMVDLNPFEGASNRTAVIVLEKGKPTQYPVPYTVWRKNRGVRFTYDSTLEDVQAATRRLQFQAQPVDPDNPTSPWLTARPKALRAVRKILGQSDYEAHAGVYTGGANAVYWVEPVLKRPDGLWVVRNLTEGAKVKVEEVTETIEPDLLYPLLRGRDVQRWRAEPSAWIIIPQDPNNPSRAYPEAKLKVDYPRLYAYLKQFESVLRRRAAFQQILCKREPEFYGIMDIGHYSFSPWKVVWTRLAKIEAAVVGLHGRKPVIPQETVSLVQCDTKEEAYYIAALVNSTAFQFAATSYSQEGGKSMGSMHILEHIRIPRYQPTDPVHRRLAELSQAAHKAAQAGDEKRLEALEAEIDREAAKLWGLTEAELREIQESLRELEGEVPAAEEEA